MSDGDHELVLTAPATRAIPPGLPESVAVPAIEFLIRALVENPQRVGKQLRGHLAAIAARRGTYRVLYRINEVEREGVALRIEHNRSPLSEGSYSALLDALFTRVLPGGLITQQHFLSCGCGCGGARGYG